MSTWEFIYIFGGKAMKRYIGSLLFFAITQHALANEPIDFMTFEERTESSEKTLQDEFKKLNSGWEEAAILHGDGFSPYLNTALRQPYELPKDNAASAIGTAKEFVERNAELLGIEREDLADLNFEEIEDPLGNIAVTSRHPIAYKEVKLTHPPRYNVDIKLKTWEKQVYMVSNFTSRLGKLSPWLKQVPEISAFDPIIISALIGRELFYQKDGAEVSAGKIEEINIEPLGLSMDPIFLSDRESFRVGLTWKFQVKLKHISWTFYFSAFDGSLLHYE